jgi:hypothetical protein
MMNELQRAKNCDDPIVRRMLIRQYRARHGDDPVARARARSELLPKLEQAKQALAAGKDSPTPKERKHLRMRVVELSDAVFDLED